MKHTLINKDVLEALKEIPDESVDMVLTDPPYMISKEITISRSGNYKYKGNDISNDFGEWDKVWEDAGEYIEWSKKWWKECIRVLKPYHHFLFFFDKAKVSYAWDFMAQNGMLPRSPIFWKKTNPVPRARKVDFMISIEEMLWFTKTRIKQDYFNWGNGMSSDCFEGPIVGHTTKEDGERIHPTQKPVAMMEWLIKYLSNEGDTVLDCFAGSGTTGIATLRLGRNFTGIEKDITFFEAMRKRLDKYNGQKELEEWNPDQEVYVVDFEVVGK